MKISNKKQTWIWFLALGLITGGFPSLCIADTPLAIIRSLVASDTKRGDVKGLLATPEFQQSGFWLGSEKSNIDISFGPPIKVSSIQLRPCGSHKSDLPQVQVHLLYAKKNPISLVFIDRDQVGAQRFSFSQKDQSAREITGINIIFPEKGEVCLEKIRLLTGNAKAPEFLVKYLLQTPVELIQRDGGLLMVDKTSFYFFKDTYEFESGPLSMSGQTIKGKWRQSTNRDFIIEGIWGWMNGVSAVNDRRQMRMTIETSCVEQKTEDVSVPNHLNIKTKIYNCPFSIKEISKLSACKDDNDCLILEDRCRCPVSVNRIFKDEFLRSDKVDPTQPMRLCEACSAKIMEGLSPYCDRGECGMRRKQ